MPKHRDFKLVCRNDIGPYSKGDTIHDAAEVEAALKGEHRSHFIRIAADKEPPAEPAAPGAAELVEHATAR